MSRWKTTFTMILMQIEFDRLRLEESLRRLPECAGVSAVRDLKTPCLLLMFHLVTSILVNAEDKVTYIPDGATSPVTQLGNVEDYSGTRLKLRISNDQVRSIPSESVQSIETLYDPAHLKGIEQFQSGDVDGAVDSFRKALAREPRGWVDREIQAWILKCSQRRQDLSGAIAAFLEIVQQDPETRHWGLAPLVWVPQAVNESLRTDARQWLVSSQRPERLIGAGLLLMDPVYGEPAERELDRLARDSNMYVALLAKTQLWRLKLAARDVNDVMIENWASQIERMPRSLRSGPQYLLSRAWEIRGETRRAAAEALWIPYVYAENERIAARALSDAAEALDRSGLTREAESLYRELEIRYPWSSEARAARGRQVAKPQSPG